MELASNSNSKRFVGQGANQVVTVAEVTLIGCHEGADSLMQDNGQPDAGQ